jgi:urease gamma subunit
MAKDNTLWIQLTPTEANALMVMLDGEMESRFRYEGLDLKEWETLDLEAYKILAYHKFKTWYMENFSEQMIKENDDG